MINPLVYAIPAFAVLIGVEAWLDARQQTKTYERKDAWTNIAVGFISTFWGALFGVFHGFIYLSFYNLTPLRAPANVWWSWALLFLLDDFCYYWFHRFSHEVRFFWNFHVVHHSSNRFNLSVAVRQSWFSGVAHWIFYAPIALLGFAPWMMITMHALNLIYQFWIHTNLVKRLGFLEHILNTPSHHRVHHGVNEEYLDKNYAGVLIIWDKLFGTFTPERETPRYGIIKPLESNNWLWINCHAWAEMFQTMRERKTLRAKLRCIFGSPYMN
jgi:alkylglycerol monooxygenase